VVILCRYILKYFSAMIDKAVISAVLGDRLKDLFSGFGKEFGAELLHLANNHLLEYQVEEYNRNYSTKTLLHRVHPKPLKDFYQPLFIKKWERSGRQTFRKENKRISTTYAKELFSHKPYITLIGDAGSGKSTIVRYLFLDCIDSKFKIPVKVELRYLNDFQGTLTGYIREKVFRLHKLATNDRIIERLMSSGDFVFFLDGYDEVKSAIKDKVTLEIDELVRVYHRNCFLLTSRPYTGIDILPMFHNYEVCELNYDEIPLFINKQFTGAETELAEKIIEAAEHLKYDSYDNFLCNPLLLSMFVLTFQAYAEIPQRKSDFYNQVFDTLFSVHDSISKLAFVREKHSDLSRDQIIEVLKLFSFLSYFEEKFVFSSMYLAEKLNFIKEKKAGLSFDNMKLTYDLLVSICILKAEGLDIAFPHRSLQEYFAAAYIASMSESNKKIVYSKLVETVISRYDESRADFFLLLSELDPKCFTVNVIIPVLEWINKRLMDFLSGIEVEDHLVRLELMAVRNALWFVFGGRENEFEEYTSIFRLQSLHMDGSPGDLFKRDVLKTTKALIDMIDGKIVELNLYSRRELQTEADFISLI